MNKNEIEEKILRDKAADVESLFQLSGSIKAFLDKPACNENEVKPLLLEIAKTCHGLKRNYREAHYIRNSYGKINYKNGKTNSSFIDFERLSHLTKILANEQFETAFLQGLIKSNFFKKDIVALYKGIIYILLQEFTNKNSSVAWSDALKEVLQTLKTENTSFTIEKLHDITCFIDMYYDFFCIQDISSGDLVSAMNDLTLTTNSFRWRYTLARILSIIGEASKNFSDFFKQSYLAIPLKTLTKIRDEIGHCHSKYILNQDESLTDIYKKIAQEGLQELKKTLLEIRDSMAYQDKLITEKTVLELKNHYKKTLSQIALDIFPGAKNSHLSDTRLAEFTPYQQLILRSYHIETLSATKSKLDSELNKLKQAGKKPENSTIKPPAQSNNEARKNKLQELIATLKKKSVLTQKEQNKLRGLEKQFHNISNLKTISSIAKPIDNTAKIKQKEDALKKCEKIATLYELSIFNELLSFYKKDPLSKANAKTEEDKVHKITRRLEAEIKLLDKFAKVDRPNLQRDYAIEHSIAVIGQLIRDLHERKSQLITEILANNKIVSTAFEKNVAARNQQVMHDPFNNNTPFLNAVIKTETLPLIADITAMTTVTKQYQINEIEIKAIQELISSYNEIGEAYLRLGLLDKAEAFYIQALQFCSPVHFANNHLQDLELPKQEPELAKKIGDIGKSGYIIEYENTVVIANYDPLWAQTKIKILNNLCRCTFKKNKFSEAKKYIEEALQIYADYPQPNDLIDNQSLRELQYLLAIVNCQENFDLASLTRVAKSFIEEDYKIFASIHLHIAQALGQSEKYEQAINILKQIETQKISTPLLSLDIAYSYIRLYEAISMREEEKIERELHLKKDYSLLEINNLFRPVYIQELEAILNKIEQDKPTFKYEVGIAIENIYAQMISTLAILYGSHAARIIHDDCETAYTFIHKAINIQLKYQFNTSASYQTLGAICELKYEATKDETYFHEGLESYKNNLNNDNILTRACANAGIAYLFIKANHFNPAIPYLLAAKQFYAEPNLAKNRDDEVEEQDCSKQLHDFATKYPDVFKKQLSMLEAQADQLKAAGNIAAAALIYQRCVMGDDFLSMDVPKSTIGQNLEKYHKNDDFSSFPNLRGLFNHSHQLPLNKLKEKYKLPDLKQASLEQGLRKAAGTNQPKDLKLFLKFVNNIDAQDSNNQQLKTALHWAAHQGHVECVQILIEAGAKLDIPDAKGKTALCYAQNAAIKQLFIQSKSNNSYRL